MLSLSSTDKKICGLCGGVASYLDCDVRVIRLAFLLCTIFTGFIPGIIVYFVASIIIGK